LSLEIELQGRDARGCVRLGELQLTALVAGFGFPKQRTRSLRGFLFPAQRAHEHFASRGIHVRERQPAIAENEFAHLVGVSRAAGLDDGECAIAFPAQHQVRQLDPVVGDRGYLQLGGFRPRVVAIDQRGDESRDVMVAQLVDESVADGARGAERASPGNRR